MGVKFSMFPHTHLLEKYLSITSFLIQVKEKKEKDFSCVTQNFVFPSLSNRCTEFSAIEQEKNVEKENPFNEIAKGSK